MSATKYNLLSPHHHHSHPNIPSVAGLEHGSFKQSTVALQNNTQTVREKEKVFVYAIHTPNESTWLLALKWPIRLASLFYVK